jgi:hypothetical protein
MSHASFFFLTAQHISRRQVQISGTLENRTPPMYTTQRRAHHHIRTRRPYDTSDPHFFLMQRCGALLLSHQLVNTSTINVHKSLILPTALHDPIRRTPRISRPYGADSANGWQRSTAGCPDGSATSRPNRRTDRRASISSKSLRALRESHVNKRERRNKGHVR